jgi:hypothetical protein
MQRGSLITCALVGVVAAYDNGAPGSRLPVLGWSSWVALGPGAERELTFCRFLKLAIFF